MPLHSLLLHHSAFLVEKFRSAWPYLTTQRSTPNEKGEEPIGRSAQHKGVCRFSCLEAILENLTSDDKHLLETDQHQQFCKCCVTGASWVRNKMGDAKSCREDPQSPERNEKCSNNPLPGLEGCKQEIDNPRGAKLETQISADFPGISGISYFSCPQMGLPLEFSYNITYFLPRHLIFSVIGCLF